MKRKTMLIAAVALIAILVTATIASASGFPIFVGKGDVQTALGYNNKQLQDNAESLEFSMVSVTTTTWLCLTPGGNESQKQQITTTEGLVSHVARERNQITGFWLTGFTGDSISIVTEGAGLTPGVCPGAPTYVENSLETTPGEPTLSVNGVALQ